MLSFITNSFGCNKIIYSFIALLYSDNTKDLTILLIILDVIKHNVVYLLCKKHVIKYIEI